MAQAVPTRTFDRQRNNASTRIVYALLMFYKIIGLWTPSVSIATNSKGLTNGEIRLARSRLGVAYNLLLLGILATWGSLVLSQKTVPNYPGRSALVDSVDTSERILSVTTMAAILLRCCLSQEMALTVGRGLLRARRRFAGPEYARHRRPIARRVAVPCVATWALLLCFFVLAVWNYRVGDYPQSLVTFMAFLLEYIVSVFVCCCLLQCHAIVAFLAAKVTELNRSVDLISVSLQGKLVHSSTFEDFVVTRLVHVRETYSHLLQVTDNANELFSVPMLFVVTYVFVYTTVIIFYLVVLFMSTVVDLIVPAHSALFLSSLAVPTVVLMFQITSLKREVAETARIVHNLQRYAKDEEIISQLKLFSLQLLHEKPQFTACGFFDLDCTLLQGIIGAVTTYMVILIQFQITSTNIK